MGIEDIEARKEAFRDLFTQTNQAPPQRVKRAPYVGGAAEDDVDLCDDVLSDGRADNDGNAVTAQAPHNSTSVEGPSGGGDTCANVRLMAAAHDDSDTDLC